MSDTLDRYPIEDDMTAVDDDNVVVPHDMLWREEIYMLGIWPGVTPFGYIGYKDTEPKRRWP